LRVVNPRQFRHQRTRVCTTTRTQAWARACGRGKQSACNWACAIGTAARSVRMWPGAWCTPRVTMHAAGPRRRCRAAAQPGVYRSYWSSLGSTRLLRTLMRLDRRARATRVRMCVCVCVCARASALACVGSAGAHGTGPSARQPKRSIDDLLSIYVHDLQTHARTIAHACMHAHTHARRHRRRALWCVDERMRPRLADGTAGRDWRGARRGARR
jgi:hypothetical protein